MTWSRGVGLQIDLGVAPNPAFSKKPAVPAGFRSLEVALLEESEIFLQDWQGLIPAALKLSGLAPHPSSPSTPNSFWKLEAPGTSHTSFVANMELYPLSVQYPALCSLALTSHVSFTLDDLHFSHCR